MGFYCCVPGCYNQSGKATGISFHTFPTDGKLRKEWIRRINRKGRSGKYSLWKPTQHHRVCGIHFNPTGKKHYDDKLPTIFPHKINESRKARRPAARTLAGENNHEVEMSTSVHQPSDYNDENLNTPSVPTHLIDVEHRYGFPPLETPELKKYLHLQRGTIEKLVEENCCLKNQLQNESLSRQKCEVELKKKATEVLTLKRKVCSLQRQLQEAKKYAKEKKFCLANVAKSNKMLAFYTGFQNLVTFMILFNFLQPYVKSLIVYGSSKKGTCQNVLEGGRHMSLSYHDQLFLVLCRLRVSLLELDLAYRFNVSTSTVSNIFKTWIDFLHSRLVQIPIWPSRITVDKYMPDVFKTTYPSVRVILDCTEIFIETPSSFRVQSETYSSYKHHNTAKGLIGITPNGFISFVSSLAPGRASDKEVTKCSGLVELLDQGDAVMADRGFLIDELLAEKQAILNIPPFLEGRAQLTKDEETLTRQIANLRIHVERVIERVKTYRMLKYTVPIAMVDDLDKIWKVCCYLSNFCSEPLLDC